ncbi:hypothetical protein ACS0TY_024186 [Phlomoides rotata]
MAKEMNKNPMFIDESTETVEYGDASKCIDDDGRVKRTGLDVINGECTYNNGGDRVRTAVSSVGYSATGMGGGACCAHRLFLHHILHFHPSCRFLPG